MKAFMKALKISFEEEKSAYDPEFVKMIQQGDKDFKEGKGVKVDIVDLWKESAYNPEFEAKIQGSREQVKRGETREIDLADL